MLRLASLWILLSAASFAQEGAPPVQTFGTDASPTARLSADLIEDGRFDPFAVRTGVDETVLTFTVSSPDVIEVTWPTYGMATLDGVEVDSLRLRDDGQGADAAAGDGVFTAPPVRLRAAPLLDGSVPDVLATGMGGRQVQVQYADGRTSSVTARPYLNVGFLSPSVPVLAPSRGALGPGLDHTPYVLASVGEADDVATATARLLAVSPIEPDFVVVSGPTSDPLTSYAGRFVRVYNDEEGFGVGPYDASATFGATGTLRGVVRTAYLPNPILLNHELGHNWFGFLDSSLELSNGHWAAIERPSSGFGSEAHGVYQAFDSADGDTVRARYDVPPGYSYNDLELYLMGLIGPDDVASPIRTLVDPQLVGYEYRTALFTARGVRDVSMDEIVAAEGPREPAAGRAQTAFSLFTHVVYDRPLTDVEFTFFDALLQDYERPTSTVSTRAGGRTFEDATGGRATMTTRIFSSPVAAEDSPTERPLLSLVGANPVRGVARLRLVGAPREATVDVVDALGRRVATLPAAAEITWDTSGAAPGIYTAMLRQGGGFASVRLTVLP